MTAPRFFVALLSFSAALPSVAQDEVRVDIAKRFEQGVCDGSQSSQFFDSGESITLSVSYCDRDIKIWVPDEPFSHDIGAVTINGTGGPDLRVFIGAGSFPTDGGDMTAAARDFGGLTISNSTLRDKTEFAGRINRDLTGAIHVGELYRFDVDGQVKAQIRAKKRGGVYFDVRMGGSTR